LEKAVFLNAGLPSSGTASHENYDSACHFTPL